MPEVVAEKQSVEAVVDFLNEQAIRLNIPVILYPRASRTEAGRFLVLPAYVEGDMDAYDFATALQNLENTWNHQEPQPALVLVLRPAAKRRSL